MMLTAQAETARAATAKWTAAELLTMPDADRYELVGGELVEATMSLESSWIAGEILYWLRKFLEAYPLGRVFPEGTSFQCFPEDPERVRRPDVSFLRDGRLSPEQFVQGHCRLAPDLAVEVVSPHDNHRDLMQKLEDYFSAGVPLVWVFEAELRSVTVYEHGGATIRRLREADELTGGEVVAGFVCPVRNLFPQTRSMLSAGLRPDDDAAAKSSQQR
jgi:Uma2 family endonuclease